ncbi:hypothetical protein TNCT_630001 [Trichonephila clavata]|uniref:Uncharacterized protein n=1 Tax=Trichonephila clavata TaxID=2740835 RepID=A0A8X6HQE3_TRICU|nr:hypothetical protein TNCT_630001 [Trichonephila clavata]
MVQTNNNRNEPEVTAGSSRWSSRNQSMVFKNGEEKLVQKWYCKTIGNRTSQYNKGSGDAWPKSAKRLK